MNIVSKYKDYDIVMMAMFRWDGPYSSISIALAKEFAKTNRVFYLNHPYSLKDYFTILRQPGKEERRENLKKGRICYEKDPALPDRFTSVFLPLTLPVNFLPPGWFYDRLNGYNNTRILKAIEQVLRDRQINKYVYINCFDPYFAPVLPPRLGAALNIYQSVDDITQEAYIARHGRRLERAAVAAADLTLTTSKELYRLNQDDARHIDILNNAADISNFRQAAEKSYVCPSELSAYQGEVIGYFGNLDQLRIDYPLLKAVATRYPEKTLLLIGPLNNEEYQQIGLHRLDNVLLAGPRHITELPAYLHHFDVAIIPFLCNTLTRSIYPLKINEYLSAGKAVVSTPFSEDIESFKTHIYVSDGTADHFLRLIAQALEEDSEEKKRARIALASTNTWAARVRQFWQMVDTRLGKEATFVSTTPAN